MISELDRSFAKQGAEVGLLHRRGRIFARPRRFERIATWLNLALDVPGPAAHAEEILETIVMGLELVIGDAPILDGEFRAACIEKLLSIALLDMRPVDEIGDLKTKALPIPVHEGAAESGPRQETRPAPDRQRRLVGRIAEGHCFLDVVLH